MGAVAPPWAFIYSSKLVNFCCGGRRLMRTRPGSSSRPGALFRLRLRKASCFGARGARAGWPALLRSVRPLPVLALPAARYAVASSFSQPVRTGWADLLLNCFSPFAQEEFLRVLRPGGRMIYVVPGAEHLYQMKAVLYDTPYKNPVQEVAYPGFRAIGEREVQGTITVPHDQLEALFAMTPYYWKTPRDGAARLAALPELTTDIAFRFLLFEKL